MAANYRPDDIPNIVLIAIPHVKAMNRVIAKLADNNIGRYEWSDPDLPYGLVAITTIPLSNDKRKLLANYRLYTPVAQLEHSPLKAEVIGENPIGGANIMHAESEASDCP